MIVSSHNSISFKADDKPVFTEEQRAILEKIANGSNSELQGMARYQATSDYMHDPTRKTTHTVGTMIPLVDSFLKGATKQGNFSQKTLTGLDTGKDWGIFILAIKLYDGAINKLISKFPKLKEATEEHPALTYTGMMLSGVFVGNKAIKYTNKAINALINKFDKNGSQNLVDLFENKFGQQINSMPGANTIMNKIYTPIEAFSKTPAAKWLGLGAVVALTGLIVKNIYDVYMLKKNTDKNYTNLTQMKSYINSQ